MKSKPVSPPPNVAVNRWQYSRQESDTLKHHVALECLGMEVSEVSISL